MDSVQVSVALGVTNLQIWRSPSASGLSPSNCFYAPQLALIDEGHQTPSVGMIKHAELPVQEGPES